MIIGIRATSGAGKSTIVRRVMERYKSRTPHYEGVVLGRPRKSPLWYDCEHPNNGKPLRVLGSYESPAGGCDTICGRGTLDFVDNLIRRGHDAGFDVLYEGLIVASDCTRLPQTVALGYPVLVLYIDLDIEACLQAVRDRRLAKGNDKELKEKPTRDKHAVLIRNRERIAAAGIPTALLTREASLARILTEFQVTAN